MFVNFVALETPSSLSPGAQHSGLLKAGEVAPALAINPGDLSFTPRTHLAEGEKTLTSPSASTVYHDADGE